MVKSWQRTGPSGSNRRSTCPSCSACGFYASPRGKRKGLGCRHKICLNEWAICSIWKVLFIYLSTYLSYYLPLSFFIYLCIYVYNIYICVCKYSMLHINMFLYYLLYKVGYFTKQKFHDVHLWLLWRPSSRSIYACSSSFLSASLVLCQNYETSTYNVPRAPPKKQCNL